jgi:hypothetical protein
VHAPRGCCCFGWVAAVANAAVKVLLEHLDVLQQLSHRHILKAGVLAVHQGRPANQVLRVRRRRQLHVRQQRCQAEAAWWWWWCCCCCSWWWW